MMGVSKTNNNAYRSKKWTLGCNLIGYFRTRLIFDGLLFRISHTEGFWAKQGHSCKWLEPEEKIIPYFFFISLIESVR